MCCLAKKTVKLSLHFMLLTNACLDKSRSNLKKLMKNCQSLVYACHMVVSTNKEKKDKTCIRCQVDENVRWATLALM